MEPCISETFHCVFCVTRFSQQLGCGTFSLNFKCLNHVSMSWKAQEEQWVFTCQTFLFSSFFILGIRLEKACNDANVWFRLAVAAIDDLDRLTVRREFPFHDRDLNVPRGDLPKGLMFLSPPHEQVRTILIGRLPVRKHNCLSSGFISAYLKSVLPAFWDENWVWCPLYTLETKNSKGFGCLSFCVNLVSESLYFHEKE